MIEGLGPAECMANFTKHEQWVLAAILSLREDAYSAAIYEKVVELAQPSRVSLGVVYFILDRLEDRRRISSRLADPAPQRGGRRKRFYRVEALGERAQQSVWDRAMVALGKKRWGRRWARESIR